MRGASFTVPLLAIGCVVLILLFHFAWKYFHTRSLPMDELEGHEFESYCADLLQASDFQDVRITKGSGDFGTDILAVKDGISYAVQCKRYDKPVGVFAVQQIYAGRDYYGCMVGAVMTNQTFTPAAKDCAKKLRILLWDRSKIEEMQQWQERAFSHRKKS